MKHLAFQIEEKTDKGTTTTTSGTNRRKVISPKVRKQVIKYQGKTAIRRVQLVGQIAPHQVGIALKHRPNKAIRRIRFDQVNWS